MRFSPVVPEWSVACAHKGQRAAQVDDAAAKEADSDALHLKHYLPSISLRGGTRCPDVNQRGRGGLVVSSLERNGRLVREHAYIEQIVG